MPSASVHQGRLTSTNHGMAPLFLSFGLKQFVHDVQNGQQADHGYEDVLGPAFVFRQRRCLADGVHRQQAQQRR